MIYPGRGLLCLMLKTLNKWLPCHWYALTVASIVKVVIAFFYFESFPNVSFYTKLFVGLHFSIAWNTFLVKFYPLALIFPMKCLPHFVIRGYRIIFTICQDKSNRHLNNDFYQIKCIPNDKFYWVYNKTIWQINLILTNRNKYVYKLKKYTMLLYFGIRWTI